MGAIGNAFKSIGEGISNTLGAAGDLLGNVARLDFGGAAQSLVDVAGSGLGLAESLTQLQPSVMAANLLMEGATTALSGVKPDDPA